MPILAALIAASLLNLVTQVHSQERNEPATPPTYKVEFDIRDGGDGAAQPSQHFSMWIDELRKGVFQAGRRIAMANGTPQYVDVGVNIECAVQESDGKATLRGVIELTNITGQAILGASSEPIIGPKKVSFDKTVELNSPTVILKGRVASAANQAEPHQQVEATVTITKLN